jgi:hypothetical protein
MGDMRLWAGTGEEMTAPGPGFEFFVKMPVFSRPNEINLAAFCLVRVGSALLVKK